MLLQVIFSGLATGSIYALVALGLALIYNTTEHVNFAQGEMSMVSAFIGFTFFNYLGLPLPVAILLTLILSVLLGIIVERLVIHRAGIEHDMAQRFGGEDAIDVTPALPHAALDHAVAITRLVVVLESEMRHIELYQPGNIVLDQTGGKTAEQGCQKRYQRHHQAHEHEPALGEGEITYR